MCVFLHMEMNAQFSLSLAKVFKCAYKSHMLYAGCLTEICRVSKVISYAFAISQMLFPDGHIHSQKPAKTIFHNVTALTYSPVTTEKISDTIFCFFKERKKEKEL